MNKDLQAHLRANQVAQRLKGLLDGDTFTKIYCRHCVFQRWGTDGYGRDRLTCIGGTVGSCRKFYPIPEWEKKALAYIRERQSNHVLQQKRDETKMRTGNVQPPAEGMDIPEGIHKGVILRMDERTKPYTYDDYFVTVDELKKNNGEPLELKIGIPVSEEWTDGPPSNTKYGKFLDAFGIGQGEPFNVDEDIVGREVEYYTKNEKGKDRDGNERVYARIVLDTLKPVV